MCNIKCFYFILYQVSLMNSKPVFRKKELDMQNDRVDYVYYVGPDDVQLWLQDSSLHCLHPCNDRSSIVSYLRWWLHHWHCGSWCRGRPWSWPGGWDHVWTADHKWAWGPQHHTALQDYELNHQCRNPEPCHVITKTVHFDLYTPFGNKPFFLCVFVTLFSL